MNIFGGYKDFFLGVPEILDIISLGGGGGGRAYV